MKTIDLSTEKRINTITHKHPIEGRPFVAYNVDFIVFTDSYQKPNLGSTDSFGILIDEVLSDEKPDIAKITRTYIDAVPDPWTEFEYQPVRHDEFVGDETNSYIKYYRFWSARGLSKVPAPPTVLPEGYQLVNTIDVPTKNKNVTVTNNDGSTTDVSTVIDWGGTWYIYKYRQLVNINLAEEARIAATNFTLSSGPSTCNVPTLTRLEHTYHVLPNGPTNSEFIQATQKVLTLNDRFIGWPRSGDTVLESSVFRAVVGCLYERTTRYWSKGDELQ